MSSKKKIKLSVVPHPFKTERIDLKVKKQTFRELFEEHVNTTLPIEYALIFDNDIKISPEDYDTTPESTHVIMKMTPAGDASNEDIGTGMKVGGVLLTILGTILLFVPGFQGVGAFLAGTGVSMLFSGIALYNMDIPDLASRDTPEQLPSIRGSRNQTRIDAPVPILLGKHLLSPDNAGLPYVKVDTDEQVLHQLFCAGYEDIVIDEATIKIGNTPITSFNDILYQIRTDNAPHTYYPSRVVQNDLGIQLKFPAEEPVEYVDRTTSTNTRRIDIAISAPNGLLSYNDDGDEQSKSVPIRIQYKPTGTSTWLEHTTTTLSGSEAKTRRWEFSKVLDNATSGGSDYIASRQYDVRIFRNSEEGGDSKVVDRVYADNIQSYTAEYVSDIYDNDVPIDLATQDLLTTVSVSIKAENQLSGVIDQLNFIAQLHTLNYSGSGTGSGAWSVGASSNPASMFRYVLQDTKINPHPVPDAKINWVSLEEWYTFCEAKGYECNAVLNAEITMESMLNSITSTAKASWVPIDGLYTVVIDTIKPNVVQMFTPRNSRAFSGSRAFIDAPTVLKMQFIDAGADYISAERKVYKNDLVPDDTKSQAVNLFGVTDADQAWKMGKYMMAVTELRPETFSITVDIENLVCTKGDRVIISHDAALISLASGRIRSVLTNIAVTETEGFIADEEIPYEAAKTYSVRIRQEDGTIIDKSIQNLITPSNQVFFDTNIIGIDVIKDDDLFIFGETGEEVLDVLVAGISPADNLEASLTCVPYAPDVFDADTGIIPDYNPVVSVPGDGSAAPIEIGAVYDPNDSITNITNILALSAGNIERAGNAIVANRPAAFTLGAEASEVTIVDDGTVVYVDKYDFLLYRTRNTDSFPPEQINTVVSMNPAGAGLDTFAEARIMYVNKEDNDRIYMMGTSIIDNGTAITATAGYAPRYLSNDEFLYLDVDGFLYRGLVTDALDGAQVTTFPINDYDRLNDSQLIYANINDGSTLYVKSSLDDTVGAQVGTATVSNVSYSSASSNRAYYINYDQDLNIYRKDAIDILATEEPVFNTAGAMWVDASENVIFASLLDSNNVYSGLLDLAIESGFLEARPNEFLITGDLELGTNRISNVSIEDLDSLVVKDNVYNSAILMGAKITFRGPNYLLLDEVSLATAVGTTIQVAGTRIVLDANRVIIDGTVTANLMEASAINSKAKTVGGFFKSEYDLDNGTQKLRKDDDTIVLDFDPDRAGSELLLGGTLVGVDGTFSGTLSAAGGTFSGNLTAEKIEMSGSVFTGGTFVNSIGAVKIIDQFNQVLDAAGFNPNFIGTLLISGNTYDAAVTNVGVATFTDYEVDIVPHPTFPSTNVVTVQLISTNITGNNTVVPYNFLYFKGTTNI